MNGAPSEKEPFLRKSASRLVLFLITGVLTVLSIYAIVCHARDATQRYRFSDDVRVFVPAFYREHQGLCRRDYTLTYNRHLMPPGAAALYDQLSKVIDPVAVSKVLPYVLTLILLALVAATAHAIRGRSAAIYAVLMTCAAPVFLLQMSGGLPRSFAYSIHALAIFGTVTGRPFPLAVAALAGALFYPPAGVAAGAMLFFFLLFPPSHRGTAQHWPWQRRAALVVGTAVVCALAVAPTMFNTRKYGERIGPKNLHRYPEMSRGGRVAGPDVPPYRGVAPSTFDALRGVMTGCGLLPPHLESLRLIAKITIVIAGIAFLVIAKGSAHGRRLLLAASVAPLLYVIANWSAPFLYVPERYLRICTSLRCSA